MTFNTLLKRWLPLAFVGCMTFLISCNPPPLVESTISDVSVVRMFPGIEDHFERAVYMSYPPGDFSHIYVAQQNGEMKVFANQEGTTTATTFLDIHDLVTLGEEEGLLGFAFDPDYVTNGYVYLYYSYRTTDFDNSTFVTRFTRSAENPLVADPDSAEVIMEIPQHSFTHNGSHIMFGPDGYLYIGVGDGGYTFDFTPHAQDRTQLMGAVLRIDVHNDGSYTIPPDNPYVGNSNGYREEIWAYGFRNPYRFSFDSLNGDLWLTDVGDVRWEEVNRVIKGGNYGWKYYEGPELRHKDVTPPPDNYIWPVYAYEHDALTNYSISGGQLYRGSIASLHGKYIFADFMQGGSLTVLALSPTNTLLNIDKINMAREAVTAFMEAPDREIYLLSLSGQVFRIVEGAPPPPLGPSLESLQANVFTPSCALSSCHDDISQASGLNLSAGKSLGSLVNVASSLESSFMRVAPQDPDASYLIRKVEGSHTVGERMPLFGEPLSAAQLGALRGWIDEMPDEPLVQGEFVSEFFAGHCAACHGANRRGGVGPALLPETLVQSDAHYIDIITNGVASTLMQPWGQTLSGVEIQSMVDFLRTSPDDDEGAGTLYCDNEPEGVNWAASISDCPQLSDYRLFSDPSNPLSAANPRGHAYTLTTPLFSDYAYKHRQVFIPFGEQIQYTEGELLFPEGTFITKTFYYPDDERNPDPANNHIIETRLLIKRAGGKWVALPYIWDGDDAQLVRNGSSTEVSWIDSDGVSRLLDYQIPNVDQCAGCHGASAIKPIGPRTRFMNLDIDYGGTVGIKNQILSLRDKGLLTGVPLDFSTVPHSPIWNDDNDGSLEERARAYLDINCAHCHNSSTGTAAGSGLWLSDTLATGGITGICKPLASTAPAMPGYDYNIVPGMPESSAVIYRMNSTDPVLRMPVLGRTLTHTEGLELITAWVAELSGVCE